jgi:hypothetical protein
VAPKLNVALVAVVVPDGPPEIAVPVGPATSSK